MDNSYFDVFSFQSYRMLTYMEILDGHYEEYHTQTTDIFSTALPNDFVIKTESNSTCEEKQIEEPAPAEPEEPNVTASS